MKPAHLVVTAPCSKSSIAFGKRLTFLKRNSNSPRLALVCARPNADVNEITIDDFIFFHHIIHNHYI
jgi:hypothetical protein